MFLHSQFRTPVTFDLTPISTKPQKKNTQDHIKPDLSRENFYQYTHTVFNAITPLSNYTDKKKHTHAHIEILFETLGRYHVVQ